MTVNAINGSLLSALSAIDGIALSTISQINGQTKAASGPPMIVWTGITGAAESPTGKLTKNSGGTAWGDCGAVSVATQSADFRLTIYYEGYSGHSFIIGVGPDSSCNTYSTIDYAMFLNGNGNHDIYESGGNQGTITPNGINPQMYVIERVGSTLKYFYKNYTVGSRPAGDDAGRTQVLPTRTGVSTSAFYVNLAIFFNGNYCDAADLIWEAI